MSYCENCGAALDGTVRYCPSCGARNSRSDPDAFMERTESKVPEVRKTVVLREKSEGVGAVLSFFLPGLGQMYAGKVLKGVALLFLYMVLLPFTAVPMLSAFSAIIADPTADVSAMFGLTFLLAAVIVVLMMFYAIVDAYDGCKEYNERLEESGVRPW